MARTRYMDPAALPPIPDPETGLPRPPRAPGRGRPSAASSEAVTGPAVDHASAPEPPPDQGPVLAWYHSTRRGAIYAAVGGFVAAALLLSLRDGFQFRWVHYWELWAGLVAIGLLVGAAALRGTESSAGVEWVRGRKAWVRTYELVKVTTSVSPSGVALAMRDSGGRSLSISLATVQSDQLLWDLVYNGILHSVIDGKAETNGRVHLHLHLPYPSPYA